MRLRTKTQDLQYLEAKLGGMNAVNETTNIFCNLEKRNYSKKHITKLKTPDRTKGRNNHFNTKKEKKTLYIWITGDHYKIVTKAIARKLEKVLPEMIINEDQTGYVKGRFIGENRLVNGMFHTLKANKPGIAIFLDFRKDFDTVEWQFFQGSKGKSDLQLRKRFYQLRPNL